nr:hypothetical protein [Tanacetum cinerariifolium]
MSLTGDASHCLRNKPSGSITTWEDLKTMFLSKYCPPAHTAKKIEEINNFQQEPDETLYQAWERFKELLMKCPQHYLTEMQKVILFYNGLKVPTQKILDSKGAIPSKTIADAKVSSKKWHNTLKYGTMEHLGKVQKLLTDWQPYKHNSIILKEKSRKAAAPGFYQRNNANPSYQERRQSMEETLSKFMSESVKRHKENSNMIKEIRAFTNAAVRNQGALIKTLEI